MKRNIILLVVSAVVILGVFSYQSAFFSDKKLHVVFCDVGQGDAIYVRTPGEVDILVDGGRDNKVLNCLSSHMPMWDREIELVFATHPDADHIGGLVHILRNYKVGNFATVSVKKDTKVFSELMSLIEERGVPYKEIYSGSKFTLEDNVYIETLWPEGNFSSADSNNYSLVQVLSYGDFDVLLTGDIPFDILNSLSFGEKDIEVLKLPHHGSKTGVNDATFEKIKAGLAVISAGKDNTYGHPHERVLSLLEKYDVEYKRTDIAGTVEIITDGRTVKVVE